LQNKVKQSKDYQAFDQNFQTIQKDLHLAPAFKGKSADKLGNGMTSETVPVKDLRNIDNHSIGQIKGIESYSGTPQSPDTYRNLPTEGINLQNPAFDKAEKSKIFDSRQIDASEQTSMAFLNTQNANFKDFEARNQQGETIKTLCTQNSLPDATNPANLDALSKILEDQYKKAENNPDSQKQITDLFALVQDFHEKANTFGISNVAESSQIAKYKLTEMAYDTAKLEVSKCFLQNIL